MKKISAIILVLVLCAAMLTACQSQPKEEEITTEIENDAAVLGTWMESEFDSGFTFTADGTGTNLFWDLPFTYTALEGLITITYNDTTYGIDRYQYSVSESMDTIQMTRQNGDGTYTYTKR